MKIKHKVKLFFSKCLWYIKGVYQAVAFHKEVKDYKFLIETKIALEIKLLELKRKDKESPLIYKIECQLDLIKKILSYVSK